MKKNSKKNFKKWEKFMKAAHLLIRLQVSLLSLIVEEDKHEDLEKISKAG